MGHKGRCSGLGNYSRGRGNVWFCAALLDDKCEARRHARMSSDVSMSMPRDHHGFTLYRRVYVLRLTCGSNIITIMRGFIADTGTLLTRSIARSQSHSRDATPWLMDRSVCQKAQTFFEFDQDVKKVVQYLRGCKPDNQFVFLFENAGDVYICKIYRLQICRNQR